VWPPSYYLRWYVLTITALGVLGTGILLYSVVLSNGDPSKAVFTALGGLLMGQSAQIIPEIARAGQRRRDLESRVRAAFCLGTRVRLAAKLGVLSTSPLATDVFTARVLAWSKIVGAPETEVDARLQTILHAWRATTAPPVTLPLNSLVQFINEYLRQWDPDLRVIYQAGLDVGALLETLSTYDAATFRARFPSDRDGLLRRIAYFQQTWVPEFLHPNAPKSRLSRGAHWRPLRNVRLRTGPYQEVAPRLLGAVIEELQADLNGSDARTVSSQVIAGVGRKWCGEE
jgi:hypothetical protein